jgi:hypothetical protein
MKTFKRMDRSRFQAQLQIVVEAHVPWRERTVVRASRQSISNQDNPSFVSFSIEVVLQERSRKEWWRGRAWSCVRGGKCDKSLELRLPLLSVA